MKLEQFSPCKVVHHLPEVARYRDRIEALYARYPLHVKMDLTELCNHRCPACFYGEAHRNLGIERTNIAKGSRSIPVDTVREVVQALAAGGTRAVTLVGGGEPLLHPEIHEVLRTMNDCELQFGVITNGARPMDEELERLLVGAAWIRVSLDTLDAALYERLHRPKGKLGGNLERTLANLRNLLARRDRTTVGVSFLVQEESAPQILPFCRGVKELGVDYVQYKPVYRAGGTQDEHRRFVSRLLPDLRAAHELAGPDFKVITMLDRMGDHSTASRDFKRCWVHALTCHVGADSRVYPCCVSAYAAPMALGSLAEQGFDAIWRGPARLAVIEQLRADRCPPCWSDQTNSILEAALVGAPHPDFL